MIPGPGMPDVWAISHVLDSFVAKMNAYRASGQKLPTHRHLEGILVQSKVLPLIIDLGAIRKIAGFLSHSATLFCTFCRITSNEMERLDYNWIPREGATVLAHGKAWLQTNTITDRETSLQILVCGGHQHMIYGCGIQLNILFWDLCTIHLRAWLNIIAGTLGNWETLSSRTGLEGTRKRRKFCRI